MIEIIFIYKKESYNIEYNEPKKLKEICETFEKDKHLDKNSLCLIYKGEVVNLETDMFIEEQFGLFNLKKNKRLVFFVYEKPFQIIFVYPGKKIILKVKLNENMKDVLKKYAYKAKINLSGIIFRYQTDPFTYENIGNKTVNDILVSDIDRKARLMTISLIDGRSKTIVSIDTPEELEENININDNSDDTDDDLEVNLLEGTEEIIAKKPKKAKIIKLPTKKMFYTKNFLILLIQYIFIISITLLGFQYKINEKLLEADALLLIKYIPYIAFILFISMFIVCLSKYKKSRIMIIFHIFYPPFITYYSFLLSEFIDSKYIIIGLCLVWLEIFSLIINIFFEFYEPIYIGLSSLIFSLIGLSFFSLFWIKYWIPILYISIFYIISNAYYIFWIFWINVKCKLDHYFFSSLIFNYSLFLIISYSIKYCFDRIKDYIEERFNDRDNEVIQKNKFYLYNFIILFTQYIFIITLTIVGFEYKLNEIIIEADISLLAKYFPVIGFIFLLTLIIASISGYKKRRFMIIFYAFYPPFIIYYSFLFSAFIDSRYIIIGISLIGIEIFSMLINIFLKNFKLFHFCLYSGLLSLIGLIFFSAFWIRDWVLILYISIFWLISNGCFIFWNFSINTLCSLQSDEFFFSALIFNYNIILALSFLIKYCVVSITNYIKGRIDDNSDEIQQTKYFYLKNFFILIIQYTIIIILTIIGFEYKFNEILIEYNASLFVKYILLPCFICLSAFIIYFIPFFNEKRRKENWLIIFLVFFPPFIIYYSFLFSEFIDSKYIIVGLIIVGIELFSLLFNIFLKKFEIKHFILFQGFLSLVGLILISAFWIKDWYPILYISIFWLASNIINLLIIVMVCHFSNIDEILFSSLLFNYGIILIIIHVLFFFFGLICFIYGENPTNEEQENKLKSFGILFYQYIFIITFVWIGFAFEWYYVIEYAPWINGIISTGFFIISIHFLCLVKEPEEGCCWIVYQIIYIIIMIDIYYFFSLVLEAVYVLAFTFVIFFEILSIILSIFFYGSINVGVMFASCFLTSLVSILFFHFLWLQNGTALTWLLILCISSAIYLSVVGWATKEYYKKDVIFSAIALDYGFLSLILFLIYRFFKSVNEWFEKNT